MQTRRWLLAAIAMIALAIALVIALQGPGETGDPGDPNPTAASVPHKAYSRIVSLAPSITECLFALGLGDRVVGVTDFCDYPPEALFKSKVGGYYDLNCEAILTLQPDLVVCLPDHHEFLADLDRLGLTHLTLDHRRMTTILESLAELGRVCGVPERAQSVMAKIERRMEAVKEQGTEGSRPRVLVCVGHNMGSAAIDEVYIAGRGGFYDEMITLAGGTNAYQDDLAFPLVTGEGLLRLQPDIILDMVADLSEKGLREEDVLKQWSSLPDLKAVQAERVFLFTDDFVVVPGPRFIQILEKMAAAIHPKRIAN